MTNKSISDKPITVPLVLERKRTGPPLVALTAYDHCFAELVDSAGVDLVLVGDSLGTVIQGNTNTLSVTLDEMIYHCRCVTRAVKRALVIGDMPFLSYQISTERALESAGRLVKEGGVSAVKLEGGRAVAETIARLVEVDIPVVGHVGLTPQSFHRMGGHKVQGRSAAKGGRDRAGTRERVLEDARLVEQAGAFLLVIEGVPQELAAEITRTVSIPTIGIGAGVKCDGQILVINDLVGLSAEPMPRFVKRFANLRADVLSAVKQYADEVQNKTFPANQHSFNDLKVVKTQSSRRRVRS